MSAKIIQLEEDDTLAVEVVRATASILDTPVYQLPPLDDTIDTDLLDQLNEAWSDESVVEARLVFDYVGLTVTVDGGEIQVR